MSAPGPASDGGWSVLSVETRFENPHLQVNLETVRSPGRHDPVTWTVARRKAAVVTAPRTRDGRLLLIRQERIPLRAAIWEFPAGQIDDPAGGEPLVRQSALREMREECGCRLADDGRLVPLGVFFSSPGFTDEQAFLFLADPVVADADGHDHGEHETILDCRGFTAHEILAMVADGGINDANTLSTLARLVALGHLAPDSPR